MQTTQAVHQQIKFMPDYRLEIADKLEKLTLTVRNAQAARRINPFTDARLHNHESERSGYHFLHMAIRLCSTGTAHHEFRGLCDLYCKEDVTWCRDVILNYVEQHRAGMACMLRQELCALQYIDQFLSYIQYGLTASCASQCQQLLHDTSLLVHISDVALASPNFAWAEDSVSETVLRVCGKKLDLQSSQAMLLLVKEFNTLHQASVEDLNTILQ